MIEVVISNGDRATADTPEAAILAARTSSTRPSYAGQARRLFTVTYVVDGQHVAVLKGRAS
jgi:hypothetical protein